MAGALSSMRSMAPARRRSSGGQWPALDSTTWPVFTSRLRKTPVTNTSCCSRSSIAALTLARI